MANRRTAKPRPHSAFHRASTWLTLVVVALMSLVPVDRLGTVSSMWATAFEEAPDAASDDHTRARPAPRRGIRYTTDLVAGSTGVRAASAGAVWSTRSHTLEVPPSLAKSLLSIRDAADVVRQLTLLSASDSLRASRAEIATPVATEIQFLC